MAEDSPKLRIVNTLLLLGVLATTTMVTCSNDRLEERVIKLQKAIEAGGATSGGARGPSAPTATGGPAPSDTRVPGEASPVTVVGWGGRAAKVLYVEGAVPNAPLTLADKPRPQGDWYVQQRLSAPKTFNYYASNESDNEQVSRLILGRGGLFWVDPDHPPGVEATLATRWEISEDKLTYMYFLRKGVQFADGRPFTSADVKFTFDVIRDSEVNPAWMAGEFEDVDELTAPDPYKVVVKMKRKYWKGIYTVGFTARVLNKGWYEEQIPLYAKKLGIEKYSVSPGKPGFGEVFRKIRWPCPGTGPYYLAADEDATAERVILRQNPFHYGIQTTPTWWNFAQVRWVYIKDPVATDEAFRKQDIDVMSVPQERWISQLQSDATINAVANHYLYDHTGLGFTYFCWNNRKPPFDDKRVRVAMTHLTDREWILKEVYKGAGTVAVCPTKRIYATYNDKLEPHAFDPAKAKALLAEAGWTDTDGDGVLDKDGKRFEFVVKSSVGLPDTPRMIGVLVDACKKVGIRAEMQLAEWSTFIQDYEQRRFDCAFLGSSHGDPWHDPYVEWHSAMDVPDGQNSPGWHNKRADELCEAMRVEFDETKRNAMFKEFDRLFWEDQPVTLVVHPLVSVLQNKRFEDVKIRPTGLQIFEFWVKPENVLHK